jgi:hypothetical protein
MNSLQELQTVAARLALQDAPRSVCPRCGEGHLVIVDEQPHAIFGALGITWKTLKCDAPDCGVVTFD